MGGPTGDQIIRVDMGNLTVKTEPFPDEWKLLGGRGLSARILLAGVQSEVRSARARERAGDRARRDLGHRGAHLGAHLDRRQEPAHERHQGSQRRRQPRPGPDEARLPRHRGEGPAEGPEQALRVSHVTAEGATLVAADDCKGRWNYALIDHLATQLSADRVVHLDRAGRRDDAQGRVGRVHRSGAGAPSRAPRRARRPRRGDGEQGPQVRGRRPGQGARAPARRAQGVHGALQEVHEGLSGRPADVQDGDQHGGRGGQHAQHLPVQEPHRRAVPRRRDARRQEHRRELRDARRRHAQLHDGLHRAVQQRGARQGRQVQDLRARVRDDHAARRQLRRSRAGRTSPTSTACATSSASTPSRRAPRSRSTWIRARWSSATPRARSAS